REVDVAEVDPTRSECVESRDAMQQRGLPGSRRTHDRGVRAALERDVDAIERTDFGLAFAVDLRRVNRAGRDRGDGGTGCGHLPLLVLAPGCHVMEWRAAALSG